MLDMKIKISKTKKNQLVVMFPYSIEKVNKIKQIKGRKWNPKNKYWSISENEETIRQFKDLFSNEEVNYTEIINDMRPLNKLSNENYELISQLAKKIQLKGYSRETCKS